MKVRLPLYVLAAALCCAATAFGGLIGVNPGYPLITFNSTGVTTYSADTDHFQALATPLYLRITPAAMPCPLNPWGDPPARVVGIDLLVSDAGALLGGIDGPDLILTGQADVDGDGNSDFAGILLTGEVLEFGYREAGATDQYDLRCAVTGGALAPLYGTRDLAALITSEHSSFNDSFAVDFTGGCKGIIGPLASCQDIGLVATPSPEQLPAAGGAVTFTYVVTNGAALTLSGLAITDAWGAVPGAPVTLQIGESVTLTRVETVIPPFTNPVSVAGNLSSSLPCTHNADVTVGLLPECGLVVAATADPLAVPGDGGNVSFTYTITNQAAVPLADVAVTDHWGAVAGAPAVVQPGETVTLTIVETVVPPLTNTVTVTGNVAPNVSCTQSASATVEALPGCDVGVSIHTYPSELGPCGGLVMLRYTITNKSDFALSGFTITDAWGAVPLPPASLAAGASTVRVRTKFIKPPFTDTVTVTASGPYGDCTANAAVTYALPPACNLQVTATACPDQVPSSGKNVTFRYVIKNLAWEPLTDVTVTDNWGPVPGAPTVLQPRQTVTKTRLKFVQATVMDTVNVAGTTESGECTATSTVNVLLRDEGCAPMFWKTHTCKWAGYRTGQDFDAVFRVEAFCPNKTLLTTLGLSGGGVNGLAKEATAALLNAAHSQIDFPLSTAQVIATVQAALAPGGNIDSATSYLGGLNSTFCPMDTSAARAD